MKTRLLKIGAILIVSGLIMSVTSANIAEMYHASDDAYLPQNLAVINTFSVFVGVPVLLVGLGFLIGSFDSKLPSRYSVSLSSVVFVTGWILLVLSRFS